MTVSGKTRPMKITSGAPKFGAVCAAAAGGGLANSIRIPYHSRATATRGSTEVPLHG